MAELHNIDKGSELLQKLSGNIKKLAMPTGVSDFKTILDNNSVYLDKTLLAKEILDSPDGVILLTRPRRWGKTLAMSMLNYFLRLEVDENGNPVENNSNKALFSNLQIAKTDKMDEQGKHPVIFITLKSARGISYDAIEKKIAKIMSEAFKEYAYIYYALKKKETIESRSDLEQFDRIVSEKANIADLASSIRFLSRLLFDYHGKAPFVLIDEYDVPLNNSYNTHYYDNTLSLIRDLFEAGLKDNQYLKKGIVTGVFKIAKSGLWTGMNNTSDYSSLSEKYAQYFGFTESEVESLFNLANIQESVIKDAVKIWYNGYNVGGLKGITMYNPWSITNFFSRLELGPYWVNTESAITGDRKLSASLMITEQIHNEINLLIANFDKELTKITISPEVIFSTIYQDAHALWGLLLFGGYLSVESFSYDPMGRITALAKIPNKEVLSIYNSSIATWVNEKLSIDQTSFDFLRENFNLEDIECVRHTINNVLEIYGDRIAEKNENVFHGLIQSICLLKGNKHRLASESRSGLGRIDSIFYPVKSKSDTIVIHEYKIIKDLKDEAQLKATFINAIWQVYEKIYMEVPLLNNKYFDGLCSNVELRAIVILCSPNIGKRCSCEIMIRNHSIAEMKELAKAFRSRPQDHAKIDILKSKINAEVENYMEIYM